MSRPKGLAQLLVALLIMISGGVCHGQTQPAMKGASPGGPGEASPAPPLPPGVVVEPGNCRGFGTSYYLQTCSAPGFSALIEPMFKDRSYPAPAYEKDWQARMRPFIPCVIESLSSEDSCVRLAAVRLLNKSADSRAVGPLLELLRKENAPTGIAEEAREALAWTFKCRDVVPYIVQALALPERGDWRVDYDVQIASGPLKDPRLFDALYRLAQGPGFKRDKGSIFIALVGQRYGPSCDAPLRRVFSGLMRKPGCQYGVDGIAFAIASEETFDEIETYFFTHCTPPNPNNDGVRKALQKVGGQRYETFLRKYFNFTKDEQQKKWTAGEFLDFLAKEFPKGAPAGKDSLDWAVEKAGPMLAYAPARSVWPILELSPAAKPSAPAAERVAYFEKAVRLFSKDNELTYQLQKRLSDAYGPNGTGELEKSLEALSEANKAYVTFYARANVGAPWGQEEESLRRDISRRKMQEALRIVDARPTNPSNLAGSWDASLLVPKDAPFDLTAARAVAFLDLLGDSGILGSIPAQVSLKGQPGGDGAILSMTLRPDIRQEEGKIERIHGVRIRVLFLPGKTGYYGTVVSEEFHP